MVVLDKLYSGPVWLLHRPRGGIRVFDEPENPDFRVRIPLSPMKNRVNPDFRVFMLDFPTNKPEKPIFRSIQNPVSTKCHYPLHPYAHTRPRIEFVQNHHGHRYSQWQLLIKLAIVLQLLINMHVRLCVRRSNVITHCIQTIKCHKNCQVIISAAKRQRWHLVNLLSEDVAN